MKIKKICGAFALLLALTTVACGGGNNGSSAAAGTSKAAGASSAPAATSQQPSITVTAAEGKTEVYGGDTLQLTPSVTGVTWESSDTNVATVDANGLVTGVAKGDVTITAKKDGYSNGSIELKVLNPFLKVIPHTWTDGTPATNSDNKEYIPLTDTAANKVGVKISIQNYTIDAEADSKTAFNEKGQIDPSGSTTARLTYKVVAPKAGVYQFVMRGKSKDDALERKFTNRGLTVKINGESADIEGDRQPLTTADTDFVFAPSVNLTGEEDTIVITACYYRVQFDVASYLIFAEH